MKASYALGLFYIVSVSIIWSAASILVQYLYQGLDFDSPFLLTYIGTSLLMVLIPMFMLTERKKMLWNCCCSLFMNTGDSGSDGISLSTDEEQEKTSMNTNGHNECSSRSNAHPPTASFMKLSISSSEETPLTPHINDRNDNQEKSEITKKLNNEDAVDEERISSSLQKDQTKMQIQPLHKHDGANDMNEFDYENDNYDIDEDSVNGETDIDDYFYYDYNHSTILPHKDHIRIAMKVAPFWFISNYFYNLSLQYTTITSSTVLSSTASIFTFLFALKWGDETFNKWKLIGVIMGFCGSFLTSLHDAENNSSDDNINDDSKPLQLQLWGDIAGLISAVGYGIYTVLLRILCSDESRISMNLFLGYIGLWNSILLCPFMIWYFVADSESDPSDFSSHHRYNQNGDEYHRFLSGQQITWFVFFCLIVKGLFDNVLSDYLWARGIILTSATVATVGLGLTIPLALLSDLFVMKRTDVWTLESVLGALLVLLGFIFVNIGEEEKSEDTVDLLDEFEVDSDQLSLS